VIPAGFDYLQPTSVNEALEMMGLHPDARFLAGGHALLPESKLRHARPSTLIDLGRIAELRGIEVIDDPEAAQERGGARGTGWLVRIGAMTTSADIEYSPDIAGTVPLLPKAAALISDPLIRNRATLGGSLAAADPRGDWPPVVLAADAAVHLRSRGGERAVSARDFFTRQGAEPGAGSTVIQPGELLTAVTVPAVEARTRCVYVKRMHPGSGHAMIGVAVAITVDTDETCRACRIAIAGAGAIATRAERAEAQLVGSRLNADAVERAANAANDGIEFVGDAFGSAAYLAALLPIYVSRALTQVATAPPQI
jgi:aerobic carbon-monoxide dehydrogenase medium subunit